MSNYTIALSGLQNTAAAIDTVSNNIANANTVGYKSGEYVFADQFIQAVNATDRARVGMGSASLGVRRPMTQGTVLNSSNALDLAINGKGMFRLLQSSGTADQVDPAAVYYTRNGQFGLDNEGYLVNENGMYLTGYQPSLDGQSITDDYIKNHGLLRMPPANMPGQVTSSSTISAILDSTDQAFTESTVEFDPAQATYNNKTTQTVFDVDGNTRTLEVFYRRIGDTVLDITATADGYQYDPGEAAKPQTASREPLVTLSNNLILRMNTAPIEEGVSTAATLITTLPPVINLSNAATDAVAGHRIYVNGVDTGRAVGTLSPDKKTVTVAGATDGLAVPKGAYITFYPAYVEGPVTRAAGTATDTLELHLTVGSLSNSVVGYRVFVDGQDTGANVESVDTTARDVQLSRAITYASGDSVEFRPVHNMTLITLDGTEINTNGVSNKAGDGQILTSNLSRVEVYASLDGKFFDRDPDRTADLDLTASGNAVLGYKPISRLEFVGGRNIAALSTDPLSGNPKFRTITSLTSKIINEQAGGDSTLVFDLDLTDSSLQAGSFQITRSNQDGEPMVRLSSVSVDDQGRIAGIYGTGKQHFVGQLALVHFDNFEGLIPVGNNAFAASLDSGTEDSARGVLVGRAGTGIMGDIRAKALESSNVDMASELVRLMVLQRSYSASSQTMRAYDQALRDVIQMVS
jgi:flagellar hook protein FlgE